MDKNTGGPMYPLTEASGSVVGGVLSHVMDASNVNMPTPPPLSRLIPHALKLFQFLYLLLHYLSYQIYLLQRHSVVTLEKDLRPGHIQKVRKLVVMGENGLRKLMVLKKTPMVPIHSANGSSGLPLLVSLHLDMRRGRIFLSWNNPSSSSLTII